MCVNTRVFLREGILANNVIGFRASKELQSKITALATLLGYSKSESNKLVISKAVDELHDRLILNKMSAESDVMSMLERILISIGNLKESSNSVEKNIYEVGKIQAFVHEDLGSIAEVLKAFNLKVDDQKKLNKLMLLELHRNMVSMIVKATGKSATELLERRSVAVDSDVAHKAFISSIEMAFANEEWANYLEKGER